MKTVDELYYEVVANEELKAAFAAAAKENKLAEFLKAQGCDATAEEAEEFLEARPERRGRAQRRRTGRRGPAAAAARLRMPKNSTSVPPSAGLVATIMNVCG